MKGIGRASSQVGEHRQIVVTLAAVHFIHTQVHQPGEVQRGIGFVHMLEEHPPESSVVLAQNVASLLHRHFAHQRQSKRLKVACEMLGFPFPGQRDAPDVAAGTAAGARRRAENLGRLAKGIQMPPDAGVRVVVTDHFRMSAGRHGALQFRPELVRLVKNQKKPFRRLRLILRRADLPALIQAQQSFKCFFRYHPNILSHLLQPLETARNLSLTLFGLTFGLLWS